MASHPALDLRFAPGPGAGTLQDMLYAELDSFEPVAIHEHDAGDGWRVFFRTPAQRDGARGALAAEFGNALQLQAISVDDEDWARRSQAALKSVRVGRLVVAPPWDVPGGGASRDPESAMRDPIGESARAGSGNPDLASRNPHPAIVIVIEPSMGFGTGHHATTRLCLELLQELDIRGKRVIDVGTGSGVLAIAASKLGATDVIAMDNDRDALQNARENVERNGLTGAIDVVELDLGSLELPPAGIVIANLTSAVIQRLAKPLRSLVAPGGALIASGFGPGDLDAIVRAIDGVTERSVTSGEWTAASLSIQ